MEENLEHPWNYTHLVQFATPKTKPDYSTKEGQQALISISGQIFSKLPQIIDKLRGGGGWHVNSHSILLVDGSIVVSILLQRPK
ncbi:MAG: hypothetical protein ACYSR0_11635 [Planctomycetota bacterium]|jgi:hypothetical protein